MTLLEQIVAISMAGILSVIAPVSWLSFAAAQEVKVSADQLQQAQQAARSEAIKGKSPCRSESLNYPGESICSLDQAAVGVISFNSRHRLQLNELHILAWEHYLNTREYVRVTKSITGNSTSEAFPANWEVPVLARSKQTLDIDLSNLLYLAQPEYKKDATVIGLKEVKSKDYDRRLGKSAKKPAKSTLRPTGCFQANGQFLAQSGANYAYVNWASLPQNTTITIKATLCPNVGTN